MVNGESISEIEPWFIKLISEISDLRREIPQKEINLKILCRLPKTWEMEATAIRDHKDLKAILTV